MWRRVTLLLAVLVAAVAVQWGQSWGRSQPESDLVARGQAIYGAQCALCHGEGGRGVPGKGPSLIGVGAASVDFMLRTGRMPLPDPEARMRRSAPKVSDDERQALIAYITSLAPGQGPDIPEVDPSRGDLARGRDLFVRNCAACHGPTGAGIAVGQRDIAPALDAASPLEIAEAIRTGPGVMPVFGPEVYTQQDLDSVVAWVLDLRERAAPGGARIGRSGPVSEGLVAWTLGVGLLLVVMYLLGERPGAEQDPTAAPATSGGPPPGAAPASARSAPTPAPEEHRDGGDRDAT